MDALAWVMGEQGAEDTPRRQDGGRHFPGTSTRGPLGRAEVSLTIDNSDGALPIDYTEVTIKPHTVPQRRNEYAINGEHAACWMCRSC